jgi:hypothetical protein
MKKLALALTLLLTAGVASAHDHGGFRGGYHGGYYGGYHGGYHGGYYGGGGWVAPALIGGVIGYELARPYYQQPPVVYTQPAPTVYQNCTAWVETVDQYGNVTRTRTCY